MDKIGLNVRHTVLNSFKIMSFNDSKSALWVVNFCVAKYKSKVNRSAIFRGRSLINKYFFSKII
jgi:hypothetical protein